MNSQSKSLRQTPQIVLRSPPTWETRELIWELDVLRRERIHLDRKRQERELSLWEDERITQIIREAQSVIHKLSALSS